MARVRQLVKETTMNYAEMSIKDVAGLDGVKDLRLQVRAKFAQALRAESRGDHIEAETKLNEAVAIEQSA